MTDPVIKILVFSFGLILSSTVTSGVHAAGDLGKSGQLKAAYLFNFTKYISWPSADDNSKAPVLRLCVDATAPFKNFLDEISNGKRVGRSRYRLNIENLETASSCDLIYLSRETSKLAEPLSDAVIVADAASVYPAGPDITFYYLDKKLRFEINLEQASRKNVSISSELLKLARIK